MEEISVTVTTGRKNSINILRKLSHPVCHVKGEDPRGHGVAPSRKKLITGLATVAFLASVVVIRLVQIATTSSLVEGDMLWKGFPLYLAINGLICLVLMVALYLLLCWKEDANQRRWILKDNFSLTLGQSSKKVHFDAAISLKWNKKQKPDGVPEGPHFTKFLSNLLETLDTKLTQVSKNVSI
ncbi:hypothetical protein Fcan01_16748 [Folsomia candida]|uniref:Uncharacterized protein n=1 Tax=Folsomia candida TaxID=158441 RepID=A0A226DWP7_FOLCA|nr:hypothetical protein Fcan01_16748 [Folsomia candida]